MKFGQRFLKKITGTLILILIIVSTLPSQVFAAAPDKLVSECVPDGSTYHGTLLIKVTQYGISCIGTIGNNVTTEGTSNTFLTHIVANIYDEYNDNTLTKNTVKIVSNPANTDYDDDTNQSNQYKYFIVPYGYYYAICYTCDDSGPVNMYTLLSVDIQKIPRVKITKLI